MEIQRLRPDRQGIDTCGPGRSFREDYSPNWILDIPELINIVESGGFALLHYAISHINHVLKPSEAETASKEQLESLLGK